MQKLTISKVLATFVVCTIGFISIPTYAGQDSMQSDITQRVMQAKQKLKEAEAATGTKKQDLMGEHMKMMQETMGKMQTMKPKAGMAMKEHEDWMNEHQKLMDDMMGQMMQEHHMMMGMDCMSMSSSDKHKH